MLKVEHVKKFYGHFLALDDLNMEIGEGSLFGFVGPNGAGKTTAIRIMTGILAPDEGSVIIGDMPAGYENAATRSMIGYIPDAFGIYNNLKVSEYMEFFAAC